MIKAVVFELDGTLANTVQVEGTGDADLTQILRGSPPGRPDPNLRFPDRLHRIPGLLAARGYKIAVLTQNPSAYGSTVTDLLNIDYERLLHGKDRGVEQKLRELARSWELELSEITYVGQNTDAAELPCDFRYRPDLPPNFEQEMQDVVRTPDPNFASSARCENIAVKAFIALQHNPGHADREDLQRTFFKEIPQEARDCVIDISVDEGRFQFPPWLLSKTEIRSHPELRQLAMKAAARMFPPLPNGAGSDTVSFVPYSSGSCWKLIMQRLKDWNSSTDSSRTEVHQSLGYFPALAMAGYLSEEVRRDRSVRVVPAPSSNFSDLKPGQFSLRLAHRIAKFLGVEPAEELFEHNGGHREIRMADATRHDFPLILLDDHYTQGRTIKRAKSLLHGQNCDIRKILTWSRSMEDDVHSPDRCFFEEDRAWQKSRCLCNANNRNLELDLDGDGAADPPL